VTDDELNSVLGRTSRNGSGNDTAYAEPVLTADELRALLQDQPATPPVAEV
jgi:hypothetical protein